MKEEIVKTYFSSARGNYYFDAIFSTQISSTNTITSHPIQTGANISDHAIENGDELTFQIGMSDMMEDVNPDVTYTGDSTRSINAYNAIKQLKKDRLPISVINKFGTFKNLIIQSLVAEDNSDTVEGLRATVVLKEIFVVNVEAVKVSDRPEIIESTNEGSQNAQAIADSKYQDVEEKWNSITGLY